MTGLGRAIGGLLCRGYGPLILFGVEHFFAVEREAECGHAVKNLVRLARLELKFMDFHSRSSVVENNGIDLWPLFQKEDPGLAGEETIIVSRWNGQRENALADVVQIDINHNRFFLFCFL